MRVPKWVDNIDQCEGDVYTSALYNLTADGTKMNESFMINLPWSVEALKDFDINIDIDFIKWKEDKMPKTFLFFESEVKIAEVV